MNLNPSNLSARFRYLTTRLTHFWNRWRKEYLASLREFHKCNAKGKQRVVTVGEAVVVYEDDKKPGEWKMGAVEGLVMGRDGIVRGATVRVVTKGKAVRLSRPVQKLYPLEFWSEGEGTRTPCIHNRNKEIPSRKIPPRNAALDSRCKSRIMLDS